MLELSGIYYVTPKSGNNSEFVGAIVVTGDNWDDYDHLTGSESPAWAGADIINVGDTVKINEGQAQISETAIVVEKRLEIISILNTPFTIPNLDTNVVQYEVYVLDRQLINVGGGPYPEQPTSGPAILPDTVDSSFVTGIVLSRIDEQVVGCMDPFATNFDSTANVACSDCCTYTTSGTKGFVGGTSLDTVYFDCTNLESWSVFCNDCNQSVTTVTNLSQGTPLTQTERDFISLFYNDQIGVGCKDLKLDFGSIWPGVDSNNIGFVPQLLTLQQSGTDHRILVADTNNKEKFDQLVECCDLIRESNLGSITTEQPGIPGGIIPPFTANIYIRDGVAGCLCRGTITETTEEPGVEVPTIITINETPIVAGECDELTISAWLFFGRPSNICENNVSNGNIQTDILEVPGGIQTSPTDPQKRLSLGENVNPVEENPETINTSSLHTDNTNCCYDTTVPIVGRLVIKDEQTPNVSSVEHLDTFVTNGTEGFDTWVLLTTRVTNIQNNTFNIGLEFTSGLFDCCDYDIFIDDVQANCSKDSIRIDQHKNRCPGFDIRRVIDNKKSWVYNPGKDIISDDDYDTITRNNGDTGLIGGHGTINRLFAPSDDADLEFRETDYVTQSGIFEKHSKLVLNSKEALLLFNMCTPEECPTTISLLQLERFKKTFQTFWVQFMEQFIPATTIFVSGEKWCNNPDDICVINDPCNYEHDIDETESSTTPTVTTKSTTENTQTIGGVEVSTTKILAVDKTIPFTNIGGVSNNFNNKLSSYETTQSCASFDFGKVVSNELERTVDLDDIIEYRNRVINVSKVTV